MTKQGEFGPEEAIAFADQLVFQVRGKHLRDLEHYFLKRCWDGVTYQTIADETQYMLDTINGDIAYHLWRSLSDALGERVKRSNFKTVLERHWRAQLVAPVDTLLRIRDQQLPYVERPPLEGRCYQELLKPGGLLRIKAPQKFGKTYLINRLLAKVRENHQYLTVSFNIMRLNSAVMQALDQLLRAFCDRIADQLSLQDHAEDFWSKRKISNSSCTYFFEDCILFHIEKPLVIVLDNVDLLFSYKEVAEDFLRMLRFWHEEAVKRKKWEKVKLIVAYSTDVYIQLDINNSPFNVGVPQEPQEFDRQQVSALATQFGLEGDRVNKAAIVTLMDWVGGHPDLIQRAFQQLRYQPDMTLTALMENVATHAGLFEDHLHGLWVLLESDPSVLAAFKQVVTACEPIDLLRRERFLLSRLGIVVFRGNRVQPRNKLYRLYFQQQFQVGKQ